MDSMTEVKREDIDKEIRDSETIGDTKLHKIQTVME